MSEARKRNRVRSVFSSDRSVRTRRRRCGGMLLLGVMQKVLAKIGPQAGSARPINTRFVDNRTRVLRSSAPPARWQWCACFVARWQFWDEIRPKIARKCHLPAPGAQDCHLVARGARGCHLVGHGCTNVPPRRSGLSCCPARWQWCACFVARWQFWDEIGPKIARKCHFAAWGAQDCHLAATGAQDCHLATPGAGGADAASGRGAEHVLGVEPDHPDAYNLVG